MYNSSFQNRRIELFIYFMHMLLDILFRLAFKKDVMQSVHLWCINQPVNE